MRWSSLNSLLLVLLASVAFDGILALPLPDTDVLYPRAPTPPKRSKPPPGTPPQTRSKTAAQQQSAERPRSPPQTRSRTAAQQQPAVRAKTPSPQRVKTPPPQNPAGKGKQPAARGQSPPPAAGHKATTRASDFKTSNYRSKAIAQANVYSPGQNKVVHRESTPSQLGTLHADHIFEAQLANRVATQQGLATPQRQAVRQEINSDKNLVLAMDRLNINKGHQNTNVIRGAPSNPTPNTQRYMETVHPQGQKVAKRLDEVAGTGQAFQDAHKDAARKTGTETSKKKGGS